MRTHSVLKSVSVLSVGLLALSACGSSDAEEDNQDVSDETRTAPSLDDVELVDGGTFRQALAVEVGSIIPMSANQPQERQIITYSYESLIYITEEGEFEPWLAESWEANEDGTEVTFELKDGVTFHDGTEFNAEVAAENINYHADSANVSVVQDVLPPGVEATGDGLTLTVTMEGSDPFAATILGTIPMVASAGLADPETLEESSNGTGIYALTQVGADSFSFETRDDYTWGPEGLTSDAEGLPDGLEISVVSDESTRANLLLSGELNAASVSGPGRERLESVGYGYTGIINPIGQMLFNERGDRPTSDPLVREALIIGFNHEDAAEVVSAGNPVEINSWITESPFTCASDEPVWERPEADAERAAEFLDEAGWVENGEGIREKDGEPLSINFVYDAGSESHASAAELVREDWLNLGIDTNLLSMDGAAWSEYLYETFDYDTGWIQIGVGSPVTQDLFYGGVFPEDGGLNFMGMDDPDYAEAASEAKAASDAESACDSWQEAERIVVENHHTFWASGSINPTYMNGAIFSITDYVQAPSIRMTEQE